MRLFAPLAVVAGCAILLLVPASGGATAAADRGSLAADQSLTATRSAQASAGAAVGALFTVTSSTLDSHFCTASVVHSSHGDLAVTAAHCLTGMTAGQLVFVPGYSQGKEPYGVWQVAQIYTDTAWQSSQDPDDDVAFLRLSDARDGAPIEDITGAEQLGTAPQASVLVQVIGYPDQTDQPLACENWTKNFSATQLEFDCDGYTDGTSGSPFLADVSAHSGQGTIIGVIGGYEQGGNTPDVSYAAAFGTDVTALFQAAQAG